MLSKNKKRLRGAEVGNRPGSTAAAAAMPNKSPKQKLALLVGLAASADPPPFVRSPRTFDDGAIGLGIVAAMSGGDGVAAPPPPPPARSEPIPIASPRPAVARPKGTEWEEEEGELSESYTCVISHVGGRKRVYLDDGIQIKIDGNSGLFFQSPPPPLPLPLPAQVAPPPPALADFLSHCYLCGKKLHGLDIFMYGGDKAFCSMECRCQQILSDEQWDKCSSEALKPFESYVSPCSAPLLFAAGVAAA